jgi:hypothetical protein
MNWGTVIPVVAVVLTAIAIVLLWYWWSSSRGEEQSGDAASATRTEQDESFDTSFLSRLIETTRSMIPDSVSSKLPSIAVSRPASARQTGELVEAVKLYRDLATGSLVVELTGRRYFALSEMTDDTVRRRFMGIAESVAQFASGEAPKPAAVIPMPVPAAPVMPKASAPVPAAAEAAASEAAPPLVLKSIAEEIEELLQYRLTITPEMGQRSLHIHESHDGSIQVEVDGSYYDGVGDVPDDSIRNFLQDIIREWEARQ